jgi:putative ATP-dependent endonuclease of OLD family
MFLAEVYAENFRIFGSEEDGHHLHLVLSPGLNVIVGENDSGKSAMIDAIRYVLVRQASLAVLLS